MRPKATILQASLVLMVSASVSTSGSPPEVKLIDLKGRPQSLSQYRGKIVVLNFWATWCTSCREELPMLAEEQDRYASRGVLVVGASVDDATTVKHVPGFWKKEKVKFPVWVGATADDLEKLGLGEAVPATAFFDRDGNLVGRVLGVLRRDDLERRIEWLLGNQKGDPPEPVAINLGSKR